MDNIVVERSAFVGLVTSAVEGYNRETNGFLVGNRGTRLDDPSVPEEARLHGGHGPDPRIRHDDRRLLGRRRAGRRTGSLGRRRHERGALASAVEPVTSTDYRVAGGCC